MHCTVCSGGLNLGKPTLREFGRSESAVARGGGFGGGGKVQVTSCGLSERRWAGKGNTHLAPVLVTENRGAMTSCLHLELIYSAKFMQPPLFISYLLFHP